MHNFFREEKVKFVSKPPSKNDPKRSPKEVRVCDSSVFRLAQSMAKPEDLALMLNISVEHLKQAYGGIISKAHASTRCKLLEVLRNAAFVTKNERILIWLSKCWLGMSEPVGADPSTVINISVAEIPALEARATAVIERAKIEANAEAIEYTPSPVVVPSMPIADASRAKGRPKKKSQEDS